MANPINHTDPAQLRLVLEDLRYDPDAFIELILRQARQICEPTALVEELEQTFAKQQAEIRQLHKERDEAKRAGKLQAALFRTEADDRLGDPEPPGCKEGHGVSYRRESTLIDRWVETPMVGFQECGDPVTEVRSVRQVVEELPPIRPETIEVVTYRGDCQECGTVETPHRFKTTEVTGAAQAHLGPRAHWKIVHRMLGSEYEGVLASDCLQPHDDATPVQQKCYAHHLKAISTAQDDYEAKAGEPSSYLSAVRGLLLGAKALGKANPDLPEAQARKHRDSLEREADRLLEPGRADSLTEVEDKIRRRLKKQRDHLFVFLDPEKVPATNNWAERQLRPAVIRRKLSCGNLTPCGAEAFERMASVVETCVQQGCSVLDYLTATMSLGMEPLPLR